MVDNDDVKFDRLARFLDGLDTADPATLQEPYRTLWMRIKGMDPSMADHVHSIRSEFVIEESQDQPPGKGPSIEVISPSEVGPTFQMKVQEKPKVTFKAAGEGEAEQIKKKEQGAKYLLQVQEAIAPLRGVGGEAGDLSDQYKEIARMYKAEDFDGLASMADSVMQKVRDKEFRRSLIIQLQKKIQEYEELGADVKAAQEKFKQMALSYKEDRPDFLSLVGSCNRLAEDSVKGILGDIEEAEVIVATVVKKDEAKPLVRKVAKPKREEAEQKPAPEGKKSDTPVVETPSAEAKGPPVTGEAPEDLKPVIKIVKKRLVPLDEETPAQPPSPEERTPAAEQAPAPAVQVAQKVASEAPKEVKKTKQAVAVEKATESDLEEAFKRISMAYNVAVKMHAAGRDVKQIFDLYKFAEKARTEGSNNIYIGISKQLESMILSMQSQKAK